MWPGLENVSTNSTQDLLKFPLSGNSWFYALILVGIWLILALNLFFREKERLGVSNFLSSMAVSSFAIVLVAFLGSLVGIITTKVLGIFIALAIIIIGIWFFSDR